MEEKLNQFKFNRIMNKLNEQSISINNKVEYLSERLNNKYKKKSKNKSIDIILPNNL